MFFFTFSHFRVFTFPAPSFFGDDDGDDETDNLSSVSQRSVEESRCSEDNSTEAKAKGKARVNTAKIAQLVDNKRKHMERNLSQAQRDKILMSTAKDEVAMKKNLLDAFAQSNKVFEASMSKMTDCLTSLGSGNANANGCNGFVRSTKIISPKPWTIHGGTHTCYVWLWC